MQKLVDPLLRSKILKKISVAYFVIKGKTLLDKIFFILACILF